MNGLLTNEVYEACRRNNTIRLTHLLTNAWESEKEKIWQGYSPLRVSVYKNNIECIKICIMHGAKVNEPDENGYFSRWWRLGERA